MVAGSAPTPRTVLPSLKQQGFALHSSVENYSCLVPRSASMSAKDMITSAITTRCRHASGMPDSRSRRNRCLASKFVFADRYAKWNQAVQ